MLLQQDQRSNEIQHGEIPTFLKGHTALSSPSPLFPSGRQPPRRCGSGPACGQARSCSMQGAAAAASSAAVAEPEPAPEPAPALADWQEEMIDAHRFLFSLTLSRHRVHSSRLKRTQQHLSSSSTSKCAFLSSGLSGTACDRPASYARRRGARSCQPGCQPHPGPLA